ncbi:hypothetical protein B0T24DRAFT_487536, partial [Lasiosphaeria ovina]
LVEAVEDIYAGLVLVEQKCIELDQVDTLPSTGHLETWILSYDSERNRALVNLHRINWRDHYDFLQASQHPQGSPKLRALPIKYTMAARLWRHAIHQYLECLRLRLPDSFEFIDQVVAETYALMCLLEETVPNFSETWLECKADLAQYRMTITVDPSARATWNAVAAEQYTRVLQEDDTVGRIYHHLAVLENPNYLRCLFGHLKAV